LGGFRIPDIVFLLDRCCSSNNFRWWRSLHDWRRRWWITNGPSLWFTLASWWADV